MSKQFQPNVVLNEKWLKASLLGSVWAASEIVLGSFLHNLKIPFSGNILTSIAIIVLISFNIVWREKGLFWRAGIICAVLKTASPSAVIFGPMIAITSQAFLFELWVRVFGRTYLGFLLGAIFAMSWNFIQKIGNYLIFYGLNIVEIYKDLVAYAEKQLQLHFHLTWIPIIILLSIYIVWGSIIGVFAIYIGKKLKKSKPIFWDVKNTHSSLQLFKSNTNSYSILFLIFNILIIFISLFTIHFLKWYLWAPIVITVVVVWAIRYKRALRHLMRPRFWIFFILITMLVAISYSQLSSKGIYFIDAIILGIQMNARAIIFILGFAVVGTELYNPKIRNLFKGKRFHSFSKSLEISIETLPIFVANIPGFKKFRKNPLSILHVLLSIAESKLQLMTFSQNNRVIIISGKKGEGKTTFVQNLIPLLKSKNYSVGGILSQKIIKNDDIIGYEIEDIETNQKFPFLTLNQNQGDLIGKFQINPIGIEKGNEILSIEKQKNNQFIIIDEVGKLELESNGWYLSLIELINKTDKTIIITVKDIYVERVIEKTQTNHLHRTVNLNQENINNLVF